jgi:hypothetical protein
MMTLPVDESLILVVVMNNLRDMEIARLLGWYRIPLRSAPKVISVDYLAFYQTANFKEEKWRIRYIAPVKGYELTTRIELLRDEPDHPRAYHEYYKIQLGALEGLENPILAEGWRRLTFLYTTGARILSAKVIQDLVVDPEERPILWQALRDRASKSQAYHAESLDPLPFDPELLATFLGISNLKK